ncbi:hypothetical protein GCM10027416_21060 [Okibacterium endophyticum]
MPSSDHRRDPRTYRRRRIGVAIVFVLVLGLGVYTGTALTRTVPAAAAALTEPAVATTAPVPLTWPAYGNGAIGAVGFDGILAEHGAQQPTPMASITKTVTSLVVLSAKPLAAGESGPPIDITAADEQIYHDVIAEGGSAAPVVAGSVFTERQMLEAMMLPSANNYSISIVNWAFGSMDAFLAAAAGWLADNGLTGTSVVDSSGLDEGSASTPADLVRIGELVLEHPALSEIVRQPTAELPVIGTVHNTNQLLGTQGVIGLKTGTTNVAGACLLFAAEQVVGESTVTVVGVILGAPNHRTLSEDVLALLSSVNSAFHETDVVTAGQEFGLYTTVWGDSAGLVAAESASVLTWQDGVASVEASAAPIDAGESGDTVGTATVSYNGQTQEVPLVLTGSIEPADPFWRLMNPVD